MDPTPPSSLLLLTFRLPRLAITDTIQLPPSLLLLVAADDTKKSTRRHCHCRCCRVPLVGPQSSCTTENQRQKAGRHPPLADLCGSKQIRGWSGQPLGDEGGDPLRRALRHGESLAATLRVQHNLSGVRFREILRCTSLQLPLATSATSTPQLTRSPQRNMMTHTLSTTGESSFSMPPSPALS